jgi:hypothetical protein
MECEHENQVGQMQFVFTIGCNNEAFDDEDCGSEIGRILIGPGSVNQFCPAFG